MGSKYRSCRGVLNRLKLISQYRCCIRPVRKVLELMAVKPGPLDSKSKCSTLFMSYCRPMGYRRGEKMNTILVCDNFSRRNIDLSFTLIDRPLQCFTLTCSCLFYPWTAAFHFHFFTSHTYHAASVTGCDLCCPYETAYSAAAVSLPPTATNLAILLTSRRSSASVVSSAQLYDT